ncbi:MAG: GGDEF domain-containing protein [Bacilli bacterium]
MSILREIVISNFGTWIIVLSLLIVFIGNRFKDKYTNRLFFAFLGCVTLLDIADIGDFYLSTLETLSYWRYVTSIAGYILRPTILLLIILILFRRERKNAYIWVLVSPLIIFSILMITTPFNNWIIGFSANNSFLRGPLGYLPHIISGIYFATLLVLSFMFSTKHDKLELLTICLVSGFAIIATIIESLLDFKFLIDSALSVSCLIYYLYFFVRQSKTDELTGLHNRQSFFENIDQLRHENLVLIMVDLNGLKEINDNGGHAKGDTALITLAICLKKACTRNFEAYRVGGDEFVVVGVKQSGDDAARYIALAKQLLSKTPFMASFGFSFYQDGASFDECLMKSDTEMYIDKKNYRHR